MDPQKFFMDPDIIYPLRHMEADYFGPLFPLHDYQARVQVLKISDSSFTLQFDIEEPTNQKVMCQVRSTHVCCLKEGMRKNSIPDDLRQSLEKFVIQQ